MTTVSNGNHFYDETVRRRPSGDKTFIKLRDGTRYSYAQIDNLTAKHADVLAQFGVKTGDRVAVQAENRRT